MNQNQFQRPTVEAIQEDGTAYLKKLVEYLEKYKDSQVTPEILREMRLPNIPSFKRHLEELEKFKNGAEYMRPYPSVVHQLEQEAVATIRRVVIQACKEHGRKDIKRIQKCAQRLSKHVKWCPKSFSASRSWCHSVRKELSNRSSRQRNKAELLEAFVLQEIDEKGKIFASDARARSDEIMGVKSYKAWESFSARLRKKLHLKSETNDQNMKPFWTRK